MAGWNTSSRGSGDAFSDWHAFFALPVTLKVVDIGLLAILVGAPFFMGGRQATGQLVLCILSTLTAAAWCIHQGKNGDGRWRFCGAEPVLLLSLGLLGLQCCQLTPDLLAVLSPRVQELLPEWNSADGTSVFAESWTRISFTPNETWSNLVVIVACVQFFFVLVQRLRTVDDLCRFVTAYAFVGGVMAVFGLAQLVIGNGKFFWVYAHPLTDTRNFAKGAFTNPNHFSNFLAMALPAQLFQIVRRTDKVKRPGKSSRSFKSHGTNDGFDAQIGIWAGLMAVTGLAILLSMSRAGIIFSLAGVMLTLLIFWRKDLLGGKMTAIVAAMALASLAGTLVFGDRAARMVEENFAQLASTDLEQLDQDGGRRKIWAANLAGIAEFPLVGTGLGSHREVYWLWFNHPHQGKEYSHAENGYLQVALETGVIGLGAVVLLWLIALLWCAQGLWHSTSPRASAIVGVATAGLLTNLAHSLSDFVWYVPACMNVVLLYAACAWRVSLMRFSERDQSPTPASGFGIGRVMWWGALPVVLLVGGWMVKEKLPEFAAEPIWHEYLRLTIAKQQAGENDQFDAQQTMFHHRNDLARQAAQINPHNHRMQLHAGMACLKQFVMQQEKSESNMPLLQIREAARASFTDIEARDQWLNQPGVLGETRPILDEAMQHFRASLKSCPLQPRPYLELAELIWLDGGTPEQEWNLVEQAVAARPYDGRSQFALGRMLWAKGAQKEALPHWQEAFRLDADYRGFLIASLSTYVPASFFLENFEPDNAALVQMREAYRKSTDSDGYQLVLKELAHSSVKQALQTTGLAAGDHWLVAHECFAELKDRKAAYLSAKEAIDANPSSYMAHYRFAMWLFENGVYPEAATQLTWCSRRRPDQAGLAKMADVAQTRAESAQQMQQLPEQQTGAIAERPDGAVTR